MALPTLEITCETQGLPDVVEELAELATNNMLCRGRYHTYGAELRAAGGMLVSLVGPMLGPCSPCAGGWPSVWSSLGAWWSSSLHF